MDFEPREVDELRYEREKHTRIMPENFNTVDGYIWRLLTPPESRPPYALDLVAVVLEPVELKDGYYQVVLFDGKAKRVLESVFNQEGMQVVIDGEGINPTEIEIGYFVGSTDPLDVEFGELLEKEKNPTLVG